MKPILCVFALILSGCVTMKDFDHSVERLNARSKEEKVMASPKEAGPSAVKSCVKANEKDQWIVKLTDQDPIVKQDDKGHTGYFKVACLKQPENRNPKLKITGKHVGGGYGKAFFIVPKVSVFDLNWNLIDDKVPYLRHNKWTGHLETEMDLSKSKSKEFYVVVEGDNRHAKARLGEYSQYSYAVVPIAVDIEMLTFPTGEITLEFSKK